jgi:hypothetical protein
MDFREVSCELRAQGQGHAGRMLAACAAALFDLRHPITFPIVEDLIAQTLGNATDQKLDGATCSRGPLFC